MEPVCMVYDPRSAVQDISMVAPNVIIIEQADGQPDLALTAWNLVSQNAHAKLISLNLNDNQVGIYDRRRREILTGQDLIEVVTGP